MTAWKANTGIYFSFADCQIDDPINSDNENYVKNALRKRINLAGTQIILIGKDTKLKTRYVKWENEVATEKNCRLIAVNLDGSRQINSATCRVGLTAWERFLLPSDQRLYSMP